VTDTGRSRVRRAPPPFRPATVVDTGRSGPRLATVTIRAEPLHDFSPDGPAASVRILLPEPEGLVVPVWNGNEFLLPDGRRPGIRTLTPGRVDRSAGTLALAVVLHGGGRLSNWAESVAPGAPTAYSGPGAGYAVDATRSRYLLAGDETALPAIIQLLDAIPATSSVDVLVEIAAADGRIPLASRPNTDVTWLVRSTGAAPGTALVEAVLGRTIPDDAAIWIAGEAAAVQRIRKELFAVRGVDRSRATVRGYWKQGRAGT
jgi:NADPH-dependent ferric siderophore reductase